MSLASDQEIERLLAESEEDICWEGCCEDVIASDAVSLEIKLTLQRNNEKESHESDR